MISYFNLGKKCEHLLLCQYNYIQQTFTKINTIQFLLLLSSYYTNRSHNSVIDYKLANMASKTFPKIAKNHELCFSYTVHP